MNERERADFLARAIDDLIQGTSAPEPHFDDEELRSLLRVANARLQSGAESGRTAVNHEAAVWQRLVDRLEARGIEETDRDSDDILPPGDELRDVVSARRQMAEEVLALAEKHREEVWRRVEERINKQKPPRRRGIFELFRARTDGDEEILPPASRTRLIPTGDSELDSLLRVALGHTSLRTAGELELSDPQAQIRRRARSDPARFRPVIIEPDPKPTSWLRAAAVAALVAIAVAAIGPMPATGFADSPAGQAVRYVGEHIGVLETELTPPDPGAGTEVAGQPMSVEDASAQLGLPLVAPAAVLGMSLGTTQLFPAGVSNGAVSSFAATYASTDGTASVAVYEEAAGGSDFAIPPGSAVDVTIGDAAGTYFEGGWAPEDNHLTWQTVGTQTLLFDRDGVRFVMQYSGAAIDETTFVDAAAALFS